LFESYEKSQGTIIGCELTIVSPYPKKTLEQAELARL
jgi:hypothetical protein